MPRKDNDLIQDNTQFVKKRDRSADQKFEPRSDTPHQSPGRQGQRYPDLENWTLDELRQHARDLELAGAEGMEREDLIDAINRNLKRTAH